MKNNNFFFFDYDYEFLSQGEGRLKFTTFSPIRLFELGCLSMISLAMGGLSCFMTIGFIGLNRDTLTPDQNLITGFLFVLFAVLGLLAVGLFIRYARIYMTAIRRFLRLRGSRIFLDGTIVESRPEEIVYEFATPDGRTMRDKQRQPQTSEPLTPGTQIRVLYADDKTYLVL